MQTMQQNMAAVIRANLSKINAQKIMQAGETTGRVDRLRCMWRRGEFQSIQRNCGMLADTYTRQTNPRQSRVTMETLLGSWQPYTYVWKTQRNHYIQVLMQGPQTFTMSQFQPCTLINCMSPCDLRDLHITYTFQPVRALRPLQCHIFQPVLSQTFTVLPETFTNLTISTCTLCSQNPTCALTNLHTISTLCSQNPTCALTNLHIHTISTLCSQNTTCTHKPSRTHNFHPVLSEPNLCSHKPSRTHKFHPVFSEHNLYSHKPSRTHKFHPVFSEHNLYSHKPSRTHKFHPVFSEHNLYSHKPSRTALKTQPVLSQTFTYTQVPPCVLRHLHKPHNFHLD